MIDFHIKKLLKYQDDLLKYAKVSKRSHRNDKMFRFYYKLQR